MSEVQTNAEGEGILFGGEKGGTGKSTVSVNFAIMLCLMENDTIFVDTDSQRSTAKFLARRYEHGIKPFVPCVHIMGKHLYSELDNLAKKYRYIVVDAGGRDSVELRSAMVAQCIKNVYSPLQPSEFDLDTLGKIDELTELSLTYNADLKTHILLNQCPTHAKITTTDDAIELISNFPNLAICKTSIYHRIAQQYALSHHMSVVEYEANEYIKLPHYRKKGYLHKASQELMQLYKEITGKDFTPLIPIDTVTDEKVEVNV